MWFISKTPGNRRDQGGGVLELMGEERVNQNCKAGAGVCLGARGGDGAGAL